MNAQRRRAGGTVPGGTATSQPAVLYVDDDASTEVLGGGETEIQFLGDDEPLDEPQASVEYTTSVKDNEVPWWHRGAARAVVGGHSGYALD